MKELIPVLVELVFVVITAIIAPAVMKWLKANYTSKQLETMEIIVDAAVHAFEQIIIGVNQGPVRKEDVIKFVTVFCEQNNIEIDDEYLNILIESIVQKMNAEKEKKLITTK